MGNNHNQIGQSHPFVHERQKHQKRLTFAEDAVTRANEKCGRKRLPAYIA